MDRTDHSASWRGYWLGFDGQPPPSIDDWPAWIGWHTGAADAGHAAITLTQLLQLAEWTHARLVAPLA